MRELAQLPIPMIPILMGCIKNLGQSAAIKIVVYSKPPCLKKLKLNRHPPTSAKQGLDYHSSVFLP